MSTASDKRIVKLQLNASGAWRDVMKFEVEDADQVMYQAQELFKWDIHARKLALRIIIPGDTAPLLLCRLNEGEWIEWDERK